MPENIIVEVLGAVAAAVVAYYTAQVTTASRLSALETSIDALSGAIESAKDDVVREVESVRMEVRTYYQRRH